ncbi:hypothetical protein X797_007150 [Metarhizium robertsii]|uniref:Uncharacterized protein n=1 Tax=Metarhizium robertsii TaxID=568076 RepID=A0A0A1USW2_9HYPO|nr:hypothetical protein X797_007150 [Metarhizium robertsii]
MQPSTHFTVLAICVGANALANPQVVKIQDLNGRQAPTPPNSPKMANFEDE